ncbi:Phospholipase D alpha 1 [Bienertia sinuspersici]
MTRLLHGVLKAIIYNIDRLHIGCGLPLLNQDPRRVWRTLLYRAKAYCSCDPNLISYRLYTTVDLDKARVARTKIVTDDPSSPQWSQSFTIYCAHEVSEIKFTVKDENPVSATLVGRAYLSVEEVIQGRPVNRWLNILDENGTFIRSKLHVRVQFMDVTRDPSWSRGILLNPPYKGVPSTYFRQRQGCKVSLYQDAHVSDRFAPEFMLSGGKKYEPHRCWEDIFDAIVNAKRLIYIAGWSVNTKITLIRDPRRPKDGELARLSLGDLLIRKANEPGLRVLVLVWDDITSNVYKKDGIMATHDETTLSYFENTNVRCFKCPRKADQDITRVQGIQVDTVFTHHQKTVVVDSEIPGSEKRVIVSFLGGIDLCDGRYDTQDHSLFRTLNTVHKDDFHQPNFPGSSVRKGGPREPWHDIHCKLEGPVAWDVLYNFEQRWYKQVGDQFIYRVDEMHAMLAKPYEVISAAEDDETWNVQIFRSIDGGSVFVDGKPAWIGFPSDPNQADAVGLVCDKGNIIDRSIQDGYINAIRRAKKFIYIENQYFLGSSYAWKSDQNVDVDVDALHLIPKELSLKIVSKIEAGERFSVYVVIPMWPEGEPESGAVQAILYWQRRTMEMMYADIAAAIQRVQLDAHPRDYLSFFCLGNREILKSGEYVPTEKPPPESNYQKAQQSRRFMIYIHAKMMIVDDEYIIIGSANINQRSMDGGRDTEIAMGAYQPHYLSTGLPAKGQIFFFRMALWYEHLHQIHGSFLYPETLECMHMVNKLAEGNWTVYKSESFDQDLPGHLLPYPVQVSNFGHISELSDAEKFFPDTKASVLGNKSNILPPILTT